MMSSLLRCLGRVACMLHDAVGGRAKTNTPHENRRIFVDAMMVSCRVTQQHSAKLQSDRITAIRRGRRIISTPHQRKLLLLDHLKESKRGNIVLSVTLEKKTWTPLPHLYYRQAMCLPYRCVHSRQK